MDNIVTIDTPCGRCDVMITQTCEIDGQTYYMAVGDRGELYVLSEYFTVLDDSPLGEKKIEIFDLRDWCKIYG